MPMLGQTAGHTRCRALVPGGTYTLGVSRDCLASWTPSWAKRCDLGLVAPACDVHIDEFWIDVLPVTNFQYRQFTTATDYRIPCISKDGGGWQYAWCQETGRYPSGMDHLPVVFISYYDALAYCEWVGGRLPSEYEWEVAARGAEAHRFPWGDTVDPLRGLLRDRNVNTESLYYPCRRQAVTFDDPDKSPCGCVAMYREHLEWTSTWMAPMTCAGSQVYRKDQCRVVKGRCNPADPGEDDHAALRTPTPPWDVSACLGFRCAYSHPDGL